ncbi:MAG: putative transcriptional regulator, partial [Acidimicrobiia bacterium]|nr:putative transcriptional regulator [Acidimicrobiia bacterium]
MQFAIGCVNSCITRTPLRGVAVVARRSPQTERIVGLINYLTVDEVGHGVTLSELARRLGVSKATCYPMLEALTEAGFVIRHPARKT